MNGKKMGILMHENHFFYLKCARMRKAWELHPFVFFAKLVIKVPWIFDNLSKIQTPSLPLFGPSTSKDHPGIRISIFFYHSCNMGNRTSQICATYKTVIDATEGAWVSETY